MLGSIWGNSSREYKKKREKEREREIFDSGKEGSKKSNTKLQAIASRLAIARLGDHRLVGVFSDDALVGRKTIELRLTPQVPAPDAPDRGRPAPAMSGVEAGSAGCSVASVVDRSP